MTRRGYPNLADQLSTAVEDGSFAEATGIEVTSLDIQKPEIPSYETDYRTCTVNNVTEELDCICAEGYFGRTCESRCDCDTGNPDAQVDCVIDVASATFSCECKGVGTPPVPQFFPAFGRDGTERTSNETTCPYVFFIKDMRRYVL